MRFSGARRWRFVPVKQGTVEQFPVSVEWAKKCLSGVGKNVFNDDEDVRKNHGVQDVPGKHWGLVAEHDPGDCKQNAICKEAAGDKKNPLPADHALFGSGVGESAEWDEVNQPGESEEGELKERFAGADEKPDRAVAKGASKEAVAELMREDERPLKEQNQQSDGNVCYQIGAAAHETEKEVQERTA